jgi:hypothetical protein
MGCRQATLLGTVEELIFISSSSVAHDGWLVEVTRVSVDHVPNLCVTPHLHIHRQGSALHIGMDPEIEAALAALTDATVGSRGRVAVGNAAHRSQPLPTATTSSTSLSALARFAEAADHGSDECATKDPVGSSGADPMKRLQQVCPPPPVDLCTFLFFRVFFSVFISW